MNKQLLVSTLVLTMGFSLPGVSQALDTKSYNGGFCSGSDSSSPLFRTSKGIWNDSAGNANVFCPIVRDNSAGQIDGLEKLQVVVHNANASNGGKCTLYSLESDGAVEESATQSWSAGVGSRIVTFPALNTAANGNYTLFCVLPGETSNGRSGIREVIYGEK